MGFAETCWGDRRRQTACRRRAGAIAAAALLSLDLGLAGMMASDGMTRFRIALVPEADRCGRAVVVDEADRRRIQESMERARLTPAARPAAETIAGEREETHAAPLASRARP